MLASLTHSPETVLPLLNADSEPLPAYDYWLPAVTTVRSTKLRLSVDPGKKGAIALLDGPTLLDVTDMPVTISYGKPTLGFASNGEPIEKIPEVRNINAEGVYDIFSSWNRIYSIDEVWFEEISILPDISRHSAYEMGEGVGILMGANAGIGLANALRTVSPSVWKRRVKVTADKNTSLALARTLWPDRASTDFKLKKHDGRAEAALIGYYAHLISTS